MLVTGLTGNIAAGKSSVARLFSAWGATLIDADALARKAVAPGTPGLTAIRKRWGAKVLGADGTLDRAALRRIVFADPGERAALDTIVHPDVARRRAEAVAAARAREDRRVICDNPLLFEAGLEGTVDVIVLVDAPRDMRLHRLRHDRGLTEADAAAMIDAQWPSAAKRERADWVIDNDGALSELEARARTVFNALQSRAVSP